MEKLEAPKSIATNTTGIPPKTKSQIMHEHSKTKALSEEVFKGLRTYTLHFRFGSRPPQIKAFFHKGDKASAIERGKLHCERMNYKFCGVYPFIVDLDAQEELRNDEIYEENY